MHIPRRLTCVKVAFPQLEVLREGLYGPGGTPHPRQARTLTLSRTSTLHQAITALMPPLREDQFLLDDQRVT